MKKGIFLALNSSLKLLAGAILSLSVASTSQAANCSARDITAAANQALAQQTDSAGKLWGTQICNSATTANGFKCYNSCALVVSAILKKAGCPVSITASASGLWDKVRGLKIGGKKAFEASEKQHAGCVIGMNSSKTGGQGRLTLPGKSGPNVAFRHVAIATGKRSYIDNYSRTNTPKIDNNSPLDITSYVDAYQYDDFIYLCPTK